MNQLKTGVASPSSKTTAEKNLIKILNEPNSDISLETQLNPLLNALCYYTGTIDGLELYDKIFNHLRTSKNRLGVLKALYISHHAVNLIGKPFIKVLLSEFFPNVLPSSKPTTKEEYLLGILAGNYYNILVSYAHYFYDIQDYGKMKVEVIANSIIQGDFTHIVKLLTFKNIMKYFTTTKDSIEGALANLKRTALIEKIASLLVLNLSRIYNIISRVLKVTIEHIFSLDKDMALLLDELYSDTIQITKKITTFLEKLNLDTKESSCFEYFLLDNEFNQKEEQYIMSLKNSSTIRDLNETLYLKEKQMYQTFMVGKREYKIDSENWNFGKFNLPEKKHILQSNPSVPSLRNNLLASLISPRRNKKKNEFQKSFTSPPMDLKYFQGITNNELGMFSVRESTLSLSRNWNTPNGLTSIKSEDFDQETRKPEFNQHIRNSTISNWDVPTGNSSARGTALNLASPKKGTFSALFGRKNMQVMPFLGRSSFLSNKS